MQKETISMGSSPVGVQVKATQIEEADDYTAFFWNEGKNLSVFYYNTKGLAATAA